MSLLTRDDMVERIRKIRAQIQQITEGTDNPAIEIALRHADEQCHYALTQLAAEDALLPELENLR